VEKKKSFGFTVLFLRTLKVIWSLPGLKMMEMQPQTNTNTWHAKLCHYSFNKISQNAYAVCGDNKCILTASKEIKRESSMKVLQLIVC